MRCFGDMKKQCPLFPGKLTQQGRLAKAPSAVEDKHLLFAGRAHLVEPFQFYSAIFKFHNVIL